MCGDQGSPGTGGGSTSDAGPICLGSLRIFERCDDEEARPVQTRRIGNREVSAIGLGEMPMSIEGRPDRERSIATVHAALDAGVTLIDTADAYHQHADEVGHGESLIAEALAAYGGDTSGVLVATKGGHLRPGNGSWTVDGSPQHLKEAAEASLKRLGVESIGLYQFHRPDPKVPYEESVGAIRDLLDEGKIQMAGISNADPQQIQQGNEILGGRLVNVQNPFSPGFQSSRPALGGSDKNHFPPAARPGRRGGGVWGRGGIPFLRGPPRGGISSAGELGSRF